VSRSTYADLFSAIGDAFGVGDGSTTFNLPDGQGKYPFGKATSGTGAIIGGTFGTIDHVHTGPSHTHAFGTLSVSSGGAHTHTTGAPSATTDVAAPVGAGVSLGSSTHTHDIASGGAHTHAVDGGATAAEGTGNTGTGNPPSFVGSWIIKI